MTIHKFDSTGDAYDATQCDDNVKNGDILVIDSERVVGLAHTWPVAITEAYGKLHKINDGKVLHVCMDCDITLDQLQAAIAEARRLGYLLRADCVNF